MANFEEMTLEMEKTHRSEIETIKTKYEGIYICNFTMPSYHMKIHVLLALQPARIYKE